MKLVCGTTLERIDAVDVLAARCPRAPCSCVSHTAYSSAVRRASVEMRQTPRFSSPSNTPNTVLVLLELMTSSMNASPSLKRLRWSRCRKRRRRRSPAATNCRPAGSAARHPHRGPRTSRRAPRWAGAPGPARRSPAPARARPARTGCEPVGEPAVHPAQEMPREGIEQRFHRDLVGALVAQRRRREGGVGRDARRH